MDGVLYGMRVVLAVRILRLCLLLLLRVIDVWGLWRGGETRGQWMTWSSSGSARGVGGGIRGILGGRCRLILRLAWSVGVI